MAAKTKRIIFSRHAMDQMCDRGADKGEVIQTILEGEKQAAKKGRLSFRKNFPFEKIWKGRHYKFKQVMPIIVEEESHFVVVTVFVFYFGE